jgi:muramidase (phage lysozyme)
MPVAEIRCLGKTVSKSEFATTRPAVKLVDGQQYASFTPHFAQSFINQTMGPSEKLTSK